MSSEKPRFFTDLVIHEKTFNGKTYTGCNFERVNFENCSFKNVRFIDCMFANVNFNSCTSYGTVFDDCHLYGLMFLKSKFMSASIKDSTIDDCRFYNSIFLETIFKDGKITKTLMENSSFVKTTIDNASFLSVSMINIDFRHSSFELLNVIDDLDIQDSNFSNCEFITSYLQTPLITSTIFDNSEFFEVTIFDQTLVEDNSFENIKNDGTNERLKRMISNSRHVSRIWETVKFDILGPVSDLPQTLSSTKFRHLQMTHRYYEDGNENYDTNNKIVITHIPRPVNLFGFFETKIIEIPETQLAYESASGTVQLSTYMKRHPDAMAFLYGKDYFIFSTVSKLPDNMDIVENFNLPRLPKNLFVSKSKTNKTINQGSLFEIVNDEKLFNIKSIYDYVHKSDDLIMCKLRVIRNEKLENMFSEEWNTSSSGGRTKRTCKRNKIKSKRKNTTRR